VNKFFTITVAGNICTIRPSNVRPDICAKKVPISEISKYMSKRIEKGYIGFKSHLKGEKGVRFSSEEAFEELYKLLIVNIQVVISQDTIIQIPLVHFNSNCYLDNHTYTQIA
jgi:hypothetical protein